jgi:hypothetical protein
MDAIRVEYGNNGKKTVGSVEGKRVKFGWENSGLWMGKEWGVVGVWKGKEWGVDVKRVEYVCVDCFCFFLLLIK